MYKTLGRISFISFIIYNVAFTSLFEIFFKVAKHPLSSLAFGLFLSLMSSGFIFLFITQVIYEPIVRRKMVQNIENRVGKFTNIRDIKGFETTFSISGEKLILTDDDILYRVIINETEVIDVKTVNSL